MTLVKTSFIVALDFAVRAVLTLIILKVMALKGGASGVVLYGQFQNGIAILTLLGGGLFTNGIIRYSAEFSHDSDFQKSLWRSAMSYGLGAGLILTMICFVFADVINEKIFYSHSTVHIIQATSVLLIPCILQAIFVAISNGIEKVSLLATIRIVSASFLVLSFLLLLFEWGAAGALMSLTLGPALGCMCSLLIFHRLKIFEIRDYHFSNVLPKLKIFFRYGAMALASAIATPLVLMYVRGHAQNEFGMDQLGNWEGSYRIADQYIIFISSVLVVYFLPKVSKLADSAALKAEVSRILKYVFLVSLAGAVGIYLLRDLLISVLLSDKFYHAKELMGWQVLIAVVKISSWVYGFVLLAKGLVIEYVTGELLMALIVVGSTYLMKHLGIESLCYSFLLSQTFYFFYCRAIFLRFLKKSQENQKAAAVQPA
jgi:O-antigen/teichoic acid export membrane protein